MAGRPRVRSLSSALLGCIALLQTHAASAAPDVTFTEVAVASGLVHRLDSALPEECADGTGCASIWSGGVAAEDVDRDGDIDLYFSDVHGPGHLYQNDGGHFSDVTGLAGLGEAQASGGVYLVDVDGDGDQDLLLNTIGTLAAPSSRPQLYLSDASQRPPGSVPSFEEVGEARGLHAPRRLATSGTGISVGDYDRDGSLDIYFADWRDRVSNCDEAGARLFHGVRGAPGRFEHASLSAAIWPATATRPVEPFSFGAAMTDLDDDGRPDLLVVSDFESTVLYWGTDEGAFVADSGAAGVGTARTAMGSAIADYDNDGDLDVFVSAIFEPDHFWDGNRLYRNDGARNFSDQSDAAAVRATGWGWGATFTDLDNDGHVDLAVTAGVAPNSQVPAGYAANPTRVFRNPGTDTPWAEIEAAGPLASIREGRALVPLDYDADGDQDLLVVQHSGPPVLLRNEGGSDADWLGVRVVGHGGNRDAFGARVVLRDDLGQTQMREVGTRDGFLGHGPRIAHFGLGSGFVDRGGTVTVTVSMPTGARVDLSDVTPGHVLTVVVPPPSTSEARSPLGLPALNDCEGDGFPDFCQPDCDRDGVPDTCQVLADSRADCDGDGVIDTCLIAIGLATDCDADGIIDACAIHAGERADCDEDGVPDLCQTDLSCSAANRDAGAPDVGPDQALQDSSRPVQGRPDLGSAGRGQLRGSGCGAGPRPSSPLGASLGLALGWSLRRRRSVERRR